MIGIVLGLSLLTGAASGIAGVALCTGFAGIWILVNRRAAPWAFGVILLSLVGMLRVGPAEPLIAPHWAEYDGMIVGNVMTGPVETGRVQRFDLEGIPDRQDIRSSPARICVSAPLAPRVGYGDRIVVAGDVTWLDELPPSFQGFLRSRSCHGSLIASSIAIRHSESGVRASLDEIRRTLVANLQRAVPGDTGALLAGLVMGDDAGLDRPTRDAFIATSTSHVTAVSGSNLALIVVVLMTAGTAIGVARRWQWQLAIVGMLWAYVFLIGFSPPPVRAAGVASLAVLATRLGRRPDFVTISVLFAAFELVVRPADFGLLAFRLSTVSSVALILGLANRSASNWRNRLYNALVASSVTQLAASALLIPEFGRVSISAVPANLVIGPLCALAFPIAMLSTLATVANEDIGTAIALVAAIPARLTIEIVEKFARLPWSNISNGFLLDLPNMLFPAVALVCVAAMSRECRGGLARTARATGRLEAASLWPLLSAAGGASVGLVVGLALR